MKKKEFKPLKERAKDIASRMTMEKIDVFNWKLKKDITTEQAIVGLQVLANFITIPDKLLNDVEKSMFTDLPEVFELIKVS